MPPVFAEIENLALRGSAPAPSGGLSAPAPGIGCPQFMGRRSRLAARGLAIVAAVSYVGFTAPASATPDGEYQAMRAQFWTAAPRPLAISRAHYVERLVTATTPAATLRPGVFRRPFLGYPPSLAGLRPSDRPHAATSQLRWLVHGGHGRLGAG